ncbi:ubiquitin-like domain-containing protein [Aspergillus udagawae]|uniref:Ubiquitin-like domain-containing protein n=1 Tax=Aspergillus udagawae TaxID=91492 RepID=A0A8E0QTJ4_9EURO|nr:uncharacterized protein Aud_006662 [Aspergillus udagawae]GIC90230.1 hypothetical protein Aud_006662 [Aspergillus udagawae]
MTNSTSSLYESCVHQLSRLTSSSRLMAYDDEVPLVLWEDELGRLRIWAEEAQLPSLENRLRDTFYIREQLFRILHRLQRALTDMQDVLDDTAEEVMSDADTDEDEDDGDGTEMQMIYHSLCDTINCLFKITMVILQPVHHPLVSGKVIGPGYAPSEETQSAVEKMGAVLSLDFLNRYCMMDPEVEFSMRRPVEEWGIYNMPHFREKWGDHADTLSLYLGGIRHVLHFQSSSIRNGVLDIKQLRQHAMEVAQAASPDCIKLFHRGKLLEDNSLSCRDAGLQSQSTIYCEVLGAGESHDTSDSQDRRRQHEELHQFGEGRTQTGSLNKGKSKDRTGNASVDQTALPSPSRAPSAPDLRPFKTANEQLLALESHFDWVLEVCYSFIGDPPTAREVRNSELEKLKEIIIDQVILKADNIKISENDQFSQNLRLDLIWKAQKLRFALDRQGIFWNRK